ncbi:MAG: YfiT family bacillithiol transferase [Bryobacteraceae bacterium]
MALPSSGDLRFPLGEFVPPHVITPRDVRAWIHDIAECPSRMRAAIAGLSEEQLDTPYRNGGWTVRQVVHHLPDSHMNGYIRTRMALTEENPVIKPYTEAAWAELEDARTMTVDVSLALLEALHHRWVRLLDCLPDPAFERTYVHPEMGRVPIGLQMALYSWHSRHHVAHITLLRGRRGW